MSNNQKKKVDVSVIVMVLVVVAVLALGVFAVTPKVKTAIDTKKKAEIQTRIEQNQGTIEDHATMEYGMTADEFIAMYGLKGQVTKDTLFVEAMEKMTLKNYWNLIAFSYGDDYKYSDEKLEEFKVFYDGMMAAEEPATEETAEDPEATQAPEATEAPEAEAPEKVEVTADTTDATVKAYLYMYISQLQQEAMNGEVAVDPETGEVITTETDEAEAPEAEATTAPEAEATVAPTAAAE